MKVRNPRTGQLDQEIALPSAKELAAEAERLRDLQARWAMLAPEERSEQLLALSEAIGRHRTEIQAALEADTGRRAVSRLEIESVLALIRRWSARAPEIIAALAAERGRSALPGVAWSLDPEPVPLVGVISPWNFPLLLALTDAIPALAAGAAALVKPSEVTPRFIAPLMEAVAEVPGLPLSVVAGDGETGAAMVGLVDYLAFTGSVATGRKVAQAAAARLLPISLELGGKDPMIILACAEPARAARIALSASCRATGQACQSIERIFVARELEAPFLEALVAEAGKVTLNWPDIDRGDLGPFIFDRQAAIVEAQIADALARGATCLVGGKVERLGGGLWMRPTILVGVTPDMAVMREETFGPVLPVMAFDTLDEAVALANAGDFGLSASVVAGSLEEAARVARRLRAGAVSLNDGALTALVADAAKTSFGQSGLGPSRAGDEGLTRYLRRRVLYAQEGTPLPLSAFSEKG